MTAAAEVVFLLDVDNTLLDNDRVIADMRVHLAGTLGPEYERRYWDIFEARRSQVGYADYLGALEQYRTENPLDPHVIGYSLFLLRYPFAERLYPGTLDLIASLRHRGAVAILSDGDVVFQPRKIDTSGLWAAVGGRVLVYIHKEQMLDDIERRYPAKRYVMVDDKLRILTAMKKQWGARLTTVFVRQGHYAHDQEILASEPAADVTVEKIGDLVGVDL
jgi:FMN phosphatase YigB (HAD superfamily)